MNNHINQELEQEIHVVERDTIGAGEIIIGELLGFDNAGEPQVVFSGSGASSLSAISTVAITQEHVGRQVALLFANGDFSKPVIMGLIYSPLLDILHNNVEFVSATEKSSIPETLEAEQKDTQLAEQSEPNTAYIDGARVVLEGKEEITLKCGEASITLTKAGKILIRGKYLLNRSSGVNRIMGGSVQVN